MKIIDERETIDRKIQKNMTETKTEKYDRKTKTKKTWWKIMLFPSVVGIPAGIASASFTLTFS